jgi:hypothetical protein
MQADFTQIWKINDWSGGTMDYVASFIIMAGFIGVIATLLVMP